MNGLMISNAASCRYLCPQRGAHRPKNRRYDDKHFLTLIHATECRIPLESGELTFSERSMHKGATNFFFAKHVRTNVAKVGGARGVNILSSQGSHRWGRFVKLCVIPRASSLVARVEISFARTADGGGAARQSGGRSELKKLQGRFLKSS